jgi:hypothetical protein
MIKKLSKKQRLAIYSRAYEIYLKTWRMEATCHKVDGGKACLGLCSPIGSAGYELAALDPYGSINKQNFPEFFSYKPRTGWKNHPAFWWTISIKNGGYSKRLTILRRLADGKSKGE